MRWTLAYCSIASRTRPAVPSGELSSTTRTCMSWSSRSNWLCSDASSATILPRSLYVGRMITTFIKDPRLLKPIMPITFRIKRLNPLLLFLIPALLLGGPGTASAWNSFGHMMIAAAAYEQLTPAAHAQVSRLLQLNPDYDKWVSHTAREERDELAFVIAATWADQIKSDPAYQNDGEHPSGADAARNIGYADHLQHRYWHFIDLPFSTDHTPLVQPATPNVQTQIALFVKTL